MSAAGVIPGMDAIAAAIQPGRPMNCPHCGRPFPAPKYAGNEPRGYRNHVSACERRTKENQMPKDRMAQHALKKPSKKVQAVRAAADARGAAIPVAEAAGAGVNAQGAPTPAMQEALKAAGKAAAVATPASGPTPAPSAPVAASPAAPKATKRPPTPQVPAIPGMAPLGASPAAKEAATEAAEKAFMETPRPPVPETAAIIAAAEAGLKEADNEVVSAPSLPLPAPQEQVDAIKLAASIEAALADFGKFQVDTWKHYGVKLETLAEEVVVGSGPDEGKKLGETHVGYLARKEMVIRKADTTEKLATALAKAKDSALNTALYLWAKGRAFGPQTPENLAKQAARAEHLANHLEKLGRPANAQQQRERAERLRAAASSGATVDPAEAAAAKVPRAPKPGAIANPTGHCLCGCGADAKSNFKPGHDARVHGIAKRGELVKLSAAALDYCKAKGWVKA